MQPDSAVSATDCTIDHEPVPDTQRAAGSPTTGSAVLGEFGGCEVGVWETTPGTMTDTEADELFVVLSGAATVEFTAVTETLRKVYFG